MQRLRQAHRIARLVLAWFVLAVGLATAAPLVQPDGMTIVCSGGGGMKLVMQGDDGGEAPTSLTLDCPLCAAVAPPPVALQVPVAQPLAHATQSIPAARLAALTGAPLPARGPPAFS